MDHLIATANENILMAIQTICFANRILYGNDRKMSEQFMYDANLLTLEAYQIIFESNQMITNVNLMKINQFADDVYEVLTSL
jgi:hypothetical protein